MQNFSAKTAELKFPKMRAYADIAVVSFLPSAALNAERRVLLRCSTRDAPDAAMQRTIRRLFRTRPGMALKCENTFHLPKKEN